MNASSSLYLCDIETRKTSTDYYIIVLIKLQKRAIVQFKHWILEISNCEIVQEEKCQIND